MSLIGEYDKSKLSFYKEQWEYYRNSQYEKIRSNSIIEMLREEYRFYYIRAKQDMNKRYFKISNEH